MRARALLCVLALAGLLAACEQGPGDLCQRDSDCEDPLICVAATRQCTPPGSTGDLDAAIMYDALLPPDGAPREPDAASEPDAAPEPDAAIPPDAAL